MHTRAGFVDRPTCARTRLDNYTVYCNKRIARGHSCNTIWEHKLCFNRGTCYLEISAVRFTTIMCVYMCTYALCGPPSHWPAPFYLYIGLYLRVFYYVIQTSSGAYANEMMYRILRRRLHVDARFTVNPWKIFNKCIFYFLFHFQFDSLFCKKWEIILFIELNFIFFYTPEMTNYAQFALCGIHLCPTSQGCKSVGVHPRHVVCPSSVNVSFSLDL